MINQEKAEQAVRDLLVALGEDADRDGLVETPKRVASMYAELLAGRDTDPSIHLSKRFPVEHSGLLLEKDIPFYSLCEHHLLPFYGLAHIAYLPGKEVVGLSKLARTVETFARRLQLQEQMGEQIADAMMAELATTGVMVVITAEHLCMTMRGVKKPGSKTTTIATRGCFTDDLARQDQVLALIAR